MQTNNLSYQEKTKRFYKSVRGLKNKKVEVRPAVAQVRHKAKRTKISEIIIRGAAAEALNYKQNIKKHTTSTKRKLKVNTLSASEESSNTSSSEEEAPLQLNANAVKKVIKKVRIQKKKAQQEADDESKVEE